MIILMAGLPATGKSTIAREIGEVLPGIVLDKDAVRAALFAPAEIDYTVAQDDLCMEVLRLTSRYILERDRSRHVIVDGRPFARAYQIDPWQSESAELRVPLKVIECVCSDETARRRLALSLARREHPAKNRDYALYLDLKGQFETIAPPKLVLNTEQSVTECVDRAITYLTETV
jgi:adenylylsulfate kinase